MVSWSHANKQSTVVIKQQQFRQDFAIDILYKLLHISIL